MSLINEALKKAQKHRTGEPETLAPASGGSGHTLITRRSEPRTTQQLVLIAAGALVLIVLSIVGTFWFVNRAPEPKPAPTPIAAKPAEASAPSPIVVAPAIRPPAVASEPPAKPPTPLAVAPTPAPAPVTPTLPPPEKVAPAPTEPVTAAPPPAAPPPAANATPPAFDPRVHAFVDAVRVAGIRSSASGDSRVLMNDRVYRLNDIVDRALGIRLTKVEPNTLTFTDANGATYVKNF
jgi:hypothetical protein